MNTVVGYALFSSLLFLGLHYAVAVLASTILGVLFNFKTTGILVFRSTDNRLLLRFAGVYALMYCMSVAFLKLLDSVHIDMYRAGLLVFPFTIGLSFVLNKRFVFRKA